MTLTIAHALAVVTFAGFYYLMRPRRLLNTPPIVYLTDDEIFRCPRQAYETALKGYGSVIGVHRKSRLEYIVDESHVPQVLTNDSLFSAERGIAKVGILWIEYLDFADRFMGAGAGLDKLVHKGVTPILEKLLRRLNPIFQRRMFRLAAQADKNVKKPVPVDLAHSVHETIAESMILLITGEENPDPELIRATVKVADYMATGSGIYENLGYWPRTFPSVCRILTWIRLGVMIPWTFRRIGWRVWKDLKHAREIGNTDHVDPDCLVSFLVKDCGHIPGVMESIWILLLTLFIILGSIHQTSVVIIWIVYEMALRKEYLPALREELGDILETDPDTGKPTLTYASLRNAELLDSFIREVLRMKGDLIGLVRLTTKDVSLGGYVIPKGSLITPIATLSHQNAKNWGEDANKFIGDRWIGTDKTAASISTSYWPFGLGRFACPGRFLAVAEIKLIILILISQVDIFLEGGKYEIIDPLNTVSVPPRGQLLIQPLENPLL